MVRRDELRRSVRTKNVDRPLSPNDEPPPMPYPIFIIIDDSTCLVIMVTENYSLSSVAVRRWNCFIGSPQTNLPITPCHVIDSRPPCAALPWGRAVANRSSCFSVPTTNPTNSTGIDSPKSSYRDSTSNEQSKNWKCGPLRMLKKHPSYYQQQHQEYKNTS
jgi:hypothetical protein